jgi:hypothetical protein
MLDGRRVKLVGDPCEHRFALPAVVGEHAHLDESVRAKRDIDLVHHVWRQAVLADADHWMEHVRLRAQFAALLRCQLDHP